MKNFSLLALSLFCVFSPCSAELFRFDQENFQVEPPFTLDTQTVYSAPHSLRLPLDGTAGNAALPISPVKLDGRLLGVSLNYKTTASAPSSILLVIFQNDAGKEIAQQEYPLPGSKSWKRFETTIASPPWPAISQVTLEIKHGKHPDGAALFLDNVRIENLKQISDFQQTTFAFSSFDEWKKDTFEHERLLFGEGGKHFYDWKKSGFGESAAELTGINESDAFQYPMKITSLKVSPEKIYTFKFFYNTPAEYPTNSAMVMAFFYSREGKFLEERPRKLLPKTDDWKEIQFDFVPPEGAATVDLNFRMARVGPNVQVYVNNISFSQGEPKVDLQTTINTTTKILQGQITTIMAPDDAELSCRLVNQQDETVLTPELNEQNEFAIDLAKLPDTAFKVVAEMKWADGQTLDSFPFTNYNERPWENNLGILQSSDSPPAPWKDLTYDSETRQVTSWNPKLIFSENGGLQQVTLQTPAENLLKSPVRLLINEKDIFTTAQGKDTLKVEESPNHTLLQQKLQGDGFTVNLQARTEFYGMVKYTLHIEATEDVTFNAIDLVYEPTSTDGLICGDGGWINHDVIDLKKKATFQSTRFTPMVWTGKQEAGIYTFIESVYPQTESHQEACHVFNHDGMFKTRFVNQPLALKRGETHVVEYAIGVTPFRPRTPDNPQWRFRAGKYSTGELLWNRLPYHPLFGYPKAPEDPNLIHQWLEQAGGDEVRKFNYQIPFFAMTNLPQYAYFEQDWKTTPAMIYTAENLGREHDLLQLDISQKTWQDLYLKAFKEYFTEYKFDGVYYDCVSFHEVKQEDGAISYRLFDIGNFLQRIYVVQHEVNPDTWTFSHCGASICDFNVIFSDICLTGEHYRGALTRHRYYLEFMTLEEFRIHNCTELGPLRMFLPQSKGEKAEAADVTTHTLGMVLAHDLYLYPNFVVPEITDGCRNRYYTFYDSGENNHFRPYWKEGAHPTGNDSVVCSSYENSRGALRIYLNASAEPQTITLNEDALTIYDPLTQKTSKASKGSELILKPYMMQMILAAPSEIWNGL